MDAAGNLPQRLFAPKRDEPPPELFLVDVAQWLARVMQYSATHPSCARYGERTLASLERALHASSPLTFTILKDGILMGEVPATHRAVSTRLAPHLHARLNRLAYAAIISQAH